jgi:hypothetical protein
MLKLLETADSQMLIDFIQEIKNTDLSIKESTSSALDWYYDKLTKPNSGCNIFVELENNKITKAFFTMTVSSIFGSTHKVYPFWVRGYIYALKHDSTPAAGFSDLFDAAVEYYESINYTTFYNVIQIPKKYNKSQIDKYLQGTYEKIVGKAVRYDYLFETVIDDPSTYDEFILFKMIIPKQIPDNKKILITRMDLKNEFRN